MFTWDEDGQCYVSNSEDDFIGWTLIGFEQFKEGVKRVYVKKGNSFFTVYAKDEYVEFMVPNSWNYWKGIK